MWANFIQALVEGKPVDVILMRTGWGSRYLAPVTHCPKIVGEVLIRMQEGARANVGLLALSLLITSTAASLAADQHIACRFAGTICNTCDKSDDRAIERTLTFYLDDTNKKLVPEGSVASARTNSYSDTEVRADISINSVPKSGAATIIIDRVKGTAVVTALVLPAGIDRETAECHEVETPPTQ
jgi:hypothetical protein